jgi:hypothetical protein
MAMNRRNNEIVKSGRLTLIVKKHGRCEDQIGFGEDEQTSGLIGDATILGLVNKR